MREALETLTGGEVAAEDWTTADERLAQKRLVERLERTSKPAA